MDDKRRLEGTCEIVWSNDVVEKARCRIDLETQHFICELPDNNPASLKSAIDTGEVPIIREVNIFTPYGSLYAENLHPAFLNRHEIYSRLTSYETYGSKLSGISGSPRIASFVFNKPLKFRTDTDNYEALYFPALETWKSIPLLDHLEMRGAKGFLSICGQTSLDKHIVDRAASISVGAEVQRFMEWEGKKVSINLNYYLPAQTTRPLVSFGKKYISYDKMSENIQEVFCCSVSYFSKLNDTEYRKATNSLNSLLSARASSGNFTLGLLGIFHFWEWFGLSKGLNKNTLAPQLSISANEAEALIQLRNDMTHVNKSPVNALKDCYYSLFSTNHTRSYFAQMRSNDIAIVNYLHTVTADAFLRQIGYTGETQPYIPLP